jgi:hypothetical protein
MGLGHAGLEIGVLLVVLVVAVAARDPRPAIGAAVYLVPGLFFAVEERVTTGAPSTLALRHWAVVTALLVAVAAAAWRARRLQLTQREP